MKPWLEWGLREQELKPHGPGIYRIALTPERFGQIRKHHDGWRAEVRDTETGVLKRYAGVWPTLKEAVEELTSINPLDL